MSIAAAFERLRARNEAALIPFVTAGDPSLALLPDVLQQFQSAGADFIEVGIPHSDPIADGSVIQASTQRALNRGVTPGSICQVLSEFQPEAPLIAMGYANTLLRNDTGESAASLRRAGFAGVIVSDLLPEEAGDWRTATSVAGLDTIFLAAPTTTDERLELIAKAATGFVYAVARTGVTGAAPSPIEAVRHLVQRIRRLTDKPVCVGFGISTPAQVSAIASFADGVIVGSQLVARLSEVVAKDNLASVAREVGSLKQATKRT